MVDQVDNNKQQEYENSASAYYEKVSKEVVKDPLEYLKQVLQKTPYKSEIEETKLKYTLLVQSILAKIDANQFDANIDKLNDKEIIDLLDYLNKSFEMVSEGKEVKYHPNFLLKLFQKIIQKKGKSIISRTISKKKTLVKSYDNFKGTDIKQI